MTEVVTSSAAASQLNLLAQRQQAFSVERPDLVSAAALAPPEQPQRPAPINEGATAGRHDDSPNRDAPRSNPGPSRARVEIHSLDLGLTPSEVVGTVDVLQRFDENGDGRLDLLESGAANLAREKVFTFAGLAVAPVRGAPPEPEAATVVAGKFQGEAAAATAAEPKRIYADAAVAATGAPAARVDVPKRFYGQGVEVVIGPAAVQADTTVRLSDRVVASEQPATTEDGTGEARLHDKVAQTDAGNAGQQSAGGESGQLYDRAQLIAAAIQASKKTVVGEAYAGAGASDAAATTVVTA
jgi:hypothetical protein